MPDEKIDQKRPVEGSVANSKYRRFPGLFCIMTEALSGWYCRRRLAQARQHKQVKTVFATEPYGVVVI